MNTQQRHKLAVDIAEILAAVHNIPLEKVQAVTQKYAKICRNENKTVQHDFDYSTAKAHILEISNGKINLDNFKTTIPTGGLALCHNDLHAGNMVVKDNKLNCFIDFGEAGVNPRITDFFHLYRLDRDLAVDVIKEYNKISDYKIDIKAADYQFLSNTGYTLEKRKDRTSFKPEVAKVLENFAGSYQREILNQKQIQITKNKIH
jgi:thiamine kinase-like enzyme